MPGPIRILNGLAAAATILVAAAGLSGCGGDSAREVPHRMGSSPAGQTVLLSREFSLLRRETRGSDRLPDGLVADELVARLGLDLSGTKLVRAAPLSRIYAVPGRKAICLLDTSGVSSPCWPPGTVEEGKAVSTSFCSRRLPAGLLQIVGVVPDGVSAVSIVRNDGTRATARVKHNVFLVRLAKGAPLPSRIAWSRAGRVHSQTAGVSPRLARTHCAFDS